MIEPARIVTSGKIKTDVNTVKKNINFWNDLHRLGLTEVHEKASAATWHLANCVVAVREFEASVTEILLLVARRQTDYRWVYGLQPEETARESWNQVLLLMPRELWDKPYHPLEHPLAQIRSDIAILAESYQKMSELARLVRVNESAQAQYGVDQSGRATPEAITDVHKQIAQAEIFKREQDTLPGLAPEQLAENFLKLIRPRQQTPRRTRRQLTSPPELPPVEQGQAPSAATSAQPKRKTTEAKWRRDWKHIEPLFNQGTEIAVIAKTLGFSRDRVSRIVAWANTKPK